MALIHRPGFTRPRNYGLWSYDIPEFQVDFIQGGKGFTLDKDQLQRHHDVIFWEDGKNWGRFTGKAQIPVCYMVTDSTLSQEHYTQRRDRGQAEADLILVDWDELERFTGLGHPVRRLGYAVNDSLFYDRNLMKTVDVAYHASTEASAERQELDLWLASFCRKQGLVYSSGIRFGEEYAKGFSRAKIVVDLPRTPTTRNHRVLDSLACRTLLLTRPLPRTAQEEVVEGIHYSAWDSFDELGGLILQGLENGKWSWTADLAYYHIHTYHTWSVRARELRRILGEVFPWLT